MTTPTAPNGYDPITLVHWLWWKLRCHEGSAEDFQKLFENVIKRAHPEFMQIRPYGNIGDRKCDGLFFEDGVVFQVYSPDELKQAEVQAKIEEDLAGAVDDALLQFGGGLGRGTAEPMLCLPFLALDPTSSENQ